MILHDLPAGMHPRRVRIFLAEKGVALPTRVIDMARGDNASPEFLRLNPLGKLPVLELDDGTAITESLAICRHLEALHPEPPLFGRSPLESARIDMWTQRMDFELSRPIVDAFVHGSEFFRGRVEQMPAWAERSRAHALATMRWLDGELAGRAHVAGPDYSMADIVAQCALVLGKAAGVRIPAELPHLARWFAAVGTRPTARA
jgi:glutathione S-transferase